MNNIYKRHNLKKFQITLILAGTALIASMMSACGETAYNVSSTSEVLKKGPGGYSIPPKVDIILGEKDTGGIANAFSSVSAGLKKFLTDLDASGWDYRFTTVRLSTPSVISQAIGSSYDGNSSAWTPPFPEATQADAEMLDSDIFRTLTNYTGFVSSKSINYSAMTMEPGFESLKYFFTYGGGLSKFLRKDALTVILIVGNGNDTSDINYCTSSTGQVFPCEAVGGTPCDVTEYKASTAPYGEKRCGTYNSSFTSYQNYFKSVNSNLKFYSVVANKAGTKCDFGNDARIGTRYQEMASALNGESFDICTVPISDSLKSISKNLEATRVNYYTQYLFISKDANPSTVSVVRYAGGDTSKAVTIPEDSTNGWTYEGYQSDIYAITTQAPNGKTLFMNKTSGYAIKLNGTARLAGDDTSAVTYLPAGESPQVSK